MGIQDLRNKLGLPQLGGASLPSLPGAQPGQIPFPSFELPEATTTSKPTGLFSGGLTSDIIDVFRTLGYGTAGAYQGAIEKGMTRAKEFKGPGLPGPGQAVEPGRLKEIGADISKGVKERTTWGGFLKKTFPEYKDILDKPIAEFGGGAGPMGMLKDRKPLAKLTVGTAIETALDVGADPLAYVPPALAVKGIVGAAKLIRATKAAEAVIKTVPGLKKAETALTALVEQVAKKRAPAKRLEQLSDQTLINIAGDTERGTELMQQARKLKPEAQKLLSKYIEIPGVEPAARPKGLGRAASTAARAKIKTTIQKQLGVGVKVANEIADALSLQTLGKPLKKIRQGEVAVLKELAKSPTFKEAMLGSRQAEAAARLGQMVEAAAQTPTTGAAPAAQALSGLVRAVQTNVKTSQKTAKQILTDLARQAFNAQRLGDLTKEQVAALRGLAKSSELKHALGKAVDPQAFERFTQQVAEGKAKLGELTRDVPWGVGPEARGMARQQVLREAAAQGLDAAEIQGIGDTYLALDREMGQKLVDAGLMSKNTLAKWEGRHLRRVYQKYEDAMEHLKQLKQTNPQAAAEFESELINRGIVRQPSKQMRIPGGATAPRQTLSEELRQFLGEIQEAPYRMAKGVQMASHAAEKANFLRQVAEEFGSDAMKAGYLKLPESAALGSVAGKWVPKTVHRFLMEAIRRPGDFEKWSRRIIGAWKYGKAVMNPATQARNMISNFLLADWGAGLAPWRLDVWLGALEDITTNSALYKEAKRSGAAFIDTFREAELGGLLREMRRPGQTLQQKLTNGLAYVPQKMGDLYQLEEQWGKMAVYRFKKSQGLSAKEAAAAAEKWLFNYRKVPKIVERLRSGAWGPFTIPFITFGWKALPAMAEAMYRNPARITRYFKYAERLQGGGTIPTGEQAVLPDYMQQGQWLRLPVEDDYGRSMYLDLTYIIPFGDVGEMGGVFGAGPQPGIASLPFIDFIQDLQRNQSRFTGRPVWQEGATPEQKQQAVVGYVIQFLAPPLAGGASYRNIKSAVLKEPDWMGRTRSLNMALMGAFAGLKIRPINADEETMWRIKEIQAQIQAVKDNFYKTAVDRAVDDQTKQEAAASMLDMIDELVGEMNAIGEARSPVTSQGRP